MRKLGVVACVLLLAASCAYPEFSFTSDARESIADTSVDVTVDMGSDDTRSPDDTSVVDSTVMTLDASDGASVDTTTDSAVADTADAGRDADAAGTTVMLLARGASWRYLDDGTAPPSSTWRGGGGFDDSKWKSGPAKLGFGDGDEKTILAMGAPDGGPQYITYYFRRFITITDAASFATVTIRLRRDDGAVVYFNGSEVLRSNMPSGTVTSTTIAPTTVSGADEDTFFTYVVPAATLAEGANVVAVEIHQSDLPSSDLAFDLELLGHKP